MKLVLIEPFSTELEHVKVNAGYATRLVEAGHHVTLLASSGHLREVINCSKPIKLVTQKLPTMRAPYLSKRRALATISYCYLIRKRLHAFDRAIFLSSSPFLLLLIKILGKGLARKCDVVLHGEIQALEEPSRGLVTIRRALKFPSSIEPRYIVNARFIADRLDESQQRELSSSEVIHLPYMFSAKQILPSKRIDPASILDPLTINAPLICTAGRFSREKRSEKIIELTRSLAYRNCKADIGALGCVSESADFKLPSETSLLYPPSQKPISEEDYNAILQSCSAIVLFYTKNYFSLSLSGIFLDAIALGVPILCLENITFRRLAEEYPEAVYLFSSIDKMAEEIEMRVEKKMFSGDNIRRSFAARDKWTGLVKEDLKCAY